MPTKKEPRRSSADVRTAAKRAESNQISATRIAAKTDDDTKPSSTPASARVKAGPKDPAPAAGEKPAPRQASATQRQTKRVAETQSSPKQSQARVKANPNRTTLSDTPAPRNKAPAAASSAGAHPSEPESVLVDKAGTALSRIIANTNVGYGNILYLRGEGGGLSWDSGVAMNNDGDNEWSWSIETTDAHITFKFLINDLMWAAGDNLTVARGETSVSTPDF